MKKVTLIIAILFSSYLAKSQQYVNLLGKSKADIMDILSSNKELEFKSFDKSVDGVQFILYSVINDPSLFEAFFINNEGYCYIIKHIMPMKLYPLVIKSFKEKPNYVMKENDLWIDNDAKLVFSIRTIPNSQSFTLEVTRL